MQLNYNTTKYFKQTHIQKLVTRQKKEDKSKIMQSVIYWKDL